MSHIPFFEVEITPEIKESVRDVLKGHEFVGGGVLTHFEQQFAQKLQMSHCVGVGNGSDAILLILQSLGISKGDEVLLPANGCFATAESVARTGATVVFCDVNDRMDFQEDMLVSKITGNTKVIVVVHLFGFISNVERIIEICDNAGIKMIEDCAQAHFSSRDARFAGTFGYASAFSFYPTKTLGALGDAGAVVSNDAELIANTRLMANHGGQRSIGINSRLDTLQAAVLSARLRELDKVIQKRALLAKQYVELLEPVSQVATISGQTHDKIAHHHFPIKCERRDELKAHLLAEGIETKIHYPEAVACMSPFKLPESHYPQACKDATQLLSLPLYQQMHEDQVSYICTILGKFYAE